MLSSCGNEGPAPLEAPVSALEIVSVAAPSPLLEGSLLRVDTRGVPTNVQGDLRLEAFDGGGALVFSTAEVADAATGTVRVFELPDVLATLGSSGNYELFLSLLAGNERSPAVAYSVDLVDQLPVLLSEIGQGPVHYEDHIVIRGDGFLEPTEGTVAVVFEGELDQGGVKSPVSALSRVVLTEWKDRTRGTVRLTTDLGGAGPGQFTGTVRLESTLVGNAAVQTSPTLAVSFDFQPTQLYGFSPSTVVLGQIAQVDGAGMLGAPDRPDEATILRFEGQLTDEEGDTLPFGPAELVLGFKTGRQGTAALEYRVQGKTLVSDFFSVVRGKFVGTVTPIVIKGTAEFVGQPAQAELTLGGVRQVAVVSFLPGFHDSLHLFGLSLAAEQVEARILARMQSLYSNWAVTFVADRPDDFMPGAVATVEIGGPDPNGYGVFGYDNTPGKDVGNIRLFDSIGGENAEVQKDGSPGYGGVFIESFLWWSVHPDLSGPRPPGAPEVDPLFDEIFDAVRAQPATLVEAQGNGDPDRQVQVERAMRALSSIVGETASHEFGHSLGLANPYGLKAAYHNATPGEGCVMDGGAYRSLGERSAEPGFSESHYCGDAPDYLDEILPKETP